MPTPRVLLTPPALALLHTLHAKHGALMFFQSGGCCDGSAPMCFPLGEFAISDSDVKLGMVGDENLQVPFYMGVEQFEYWQHTQLLIDVVAGNGGMFSLENGSGQRFLTRSQVFTESQLLDLSPL